MKTFFYRIPPTLAQELKEFEHSIDRFKKGEIDPVQFKAIRVAHGVYEQRQPNTYMLRIRCPAGAIAPVQLKKVARLAALYGSGEVHFTTRCEVQIHDLLIDKIIQTIKELNQIGLSSRGGGGNTIRNILTSPYSGVDPEEVFDVDPYAIALTNRMIEESDSWNLPRKFKIAFSNSPKDTAYTQTTCLGFVAKILESTRGFEVHCAGGMGAKPMVGHRLFDFIPANKIYQVTKAIKLMFDKYGNRKSKTTSRIKFLWKKLERTEFVKLFEEEYSKLKDDDRLDLKIEPRPNGLPNKFEQSKVELVSRDKSYYLKWQKRFVTPQKQTGFFSVKLPLRLGDLLSQDAYLLCDFLAKLGENTIRCDRGQNVLLRNIPVDLLPQIYHTIMTMKQSLVRLAPFFSNMINCTGAQTCKLGICLPRGLSDAIRTKLVESDLELDRLDGFRLNMSGCPNTCGMHHIADLGFFGKVARVRGDMFPAYNVLAGGKIGYGKTTYAKKYGEVAAHHIPDLVKDYLTHYLDQEDDFTNYEDYLAHQGGEFLTSLCQRYREVPSYDEDPTYYTDFGAKKRLSLDEIGTAECSAGIFDMIGVDRKKIKQAISNLKIETSHLQRANLLKQILFSSARMLLVTRGLEGKNQEQIFDFFLKHFIKTGLISSRFETAIQVGRDEDSKVLLEHEESIIQLSSEIELLYQTMDDSLRFKSEKILQKH